MKYLLFLAFLLGLPDPLQLYKSGHFQEAQEAYAVKLSKAKTPIEKQIWLFDLGLAQSQTQSPDTTTTLTQAAKGPDIMLNAQALYSLGNYDAKKGNFDKALENYRTCLRLNPAHDDARFNYEWVLRMKPPAPPNRPNLPSPQESPPAVRPMPQVNNSKALKQRLLGKTTPPTSSSTDKTW